MRGRWLVIALLALATPAWAAPTIRGGAPGTASASTGNCTPGLPDGTQENDLMLMWCETLGGEDPTSTGWTELRTETNTAGTGSQLTVLYKTVGASETAPTVTDPGDHCVCQILTLVGGSFDPTPFPNADAGEVRSSIATNLSIPGVTTTQNDCLVFSAASNDARRNDSSFCHNWANASCTPTDIIHRSVSNGNGGALCVAYCALGTAGASGDTTVDIDALGTGGEISFALCSTPPPDPPVEFFYGFEDGAAMYGDLGSYIFSGPTNADSACTVAATPSSHDTDDDFAAYCSAMGTGTSIPIMSNLEGSAKGCFVNAERASATQYKLRLSYEDTGNECQAGLNDGAECVSDEECFSETVGESGCRDAVFAWSGLLNINEWHEVAITQTNGAGAEDGNVSCELWVDCQSICAQTRPQGVCDDAFGTSSYAWACGSNADCNAACGLTDSDPVCCPSSCTCDATDVADVTSIRWGSDSKYKEMDSTYIPAASTATTFEKIYVTTVGSASTNWVAYLDDVGMDDSYNTELACTRIQDVAPDSEVDASGWTGTRTNCGGTDIGCVQEINTNPGSDDATTHMGDGGSGGGTYTNTFGLGNIALESGDEDYPSGAGRVVGIATTGVMRDSSASGGTAEYCQTNITGQSAATGSLLSTETVRVPCGYTLNYAAAISNVDGFNNATIDVTSNLAGCGSNCGLDMTLVGAEALIAKTITTPAATALQNVNGDAITGALAMLGDSVLNDFDTEFCGAFPSVGRLSACTQGSTTLGDFLEDLDSPILDGTTGGRMNCTPIRGEITKPDYVLFMGGANTFAHWPLLYKVFGQYYACDPASQTCISDLPGYCRGGDNNNTLAWCPKRSNAITGAGRSVCYCMNHTADAGARWLDPGECDTTTEDACAACSSNSDCGTNITCATNSDCGDTCSAPYCSISHLSCASNADCTRCVSNECYVPCNSGSCATAYLGGISRTPPRYWNEPGCPNTTDCPDGIVYGPTPTAQAKKEFLEIVKSMTGRGVCTDSACFGTGTACVDNGDCAQDMVMPIFMTQPHGVRGTGVFSNFGHNAYRLEHFDEWAKQYCEVNNIPWIDFDKYLRINCKDKDARNCYRDSIHLSLYPGSETGCVYCETNTDCYSPSTCGTKAGCDQGSACSSGSVAFLDYDPLDSGRDLGLEIIKACVNNEFGVRDGICDTGVTDLCTQGAVGDACGTNTDCDTYHCEF